MGATDESGPAGELDLLVERVEIVLELHHELGVLGAAALHAVADVENHEPVVPIRQRRQAVADVDVVERTAGFRALHLPAGDLFGVIRIANIDDAHRAGGVVGEVDVAALDVGTVDAARHRFGELGDRLGVRRVFERQDHDAVLARRGTLARHPNG